MRQKELSELKKNIFSVENAQETKEVLQFYTCLPVNEAFEIIFNYFGPTVKYLVHFGSDTLVGKINSETYIKRGSKRDLSTQQ